MKSHLLALLLPITLATAQESVETYMQKEIKKAPLLDAPGPGYPRNTVFPKETLHFHALPAEQGMSLVSPMNLTNKSEKTKQTSMENAFSLPVELRLSK